MPTISKPFSDFLIAFLAGTSITAVFGFLKTYGRFERVQANIETMQSDIKRIDDNLQRLNYSVARMEGRSERAPILPPPSADPR